MRLQLGYVLTVALLSETVSAFTRSASRWRFTATTTVSSTAHRVSASISPENSRDDRDCRTILDDLRDDFEEADRVDAATERMVSERQEKLRNRFVATGTYRIQLSLAAPFGMSVSEVSKSGELSSRQLNLDTLKITARDTSDLDAQPPAELDDSQALLVTAVVKDSPADKAGVRVGDQLAAVSATIGDFVWPTSSLSGFQSALSSRKLTSGSVTLELRRFVDDSTESTATKEDSLTTTSPSVRSGRFELTLTRPLGFKVGEDSEGFVVVTGISNEACKLVRHAVSVGDRVVAVDSSFGGKLWPVSTVAGVTSAVTGRLPGQTVRMRFERINGAVNSPDAAAALPRASNYADSSKVSYIVTEAKVPPTREELVKRCRGVLKRYSAENAASDRTASQQLRAMVADKVVDALASASMTLDCVSLSLLMNFYLSCSRPEKAIELFEAATGFAGDGSSSPARVVIKGKTGGRIMPSDSSLNLFTGTALMQAHGSRGDFNSVSRVLAALEGRSGVTDDDGSLESAPWPWTGTYGSIQPDTVCYNVAVAAAEKIGGSRALLRALELFERMRDPNSYDTRPVRNEVSYNTLISALCNAGRSKEAFSLFDKMKRAGLRPDKFTYTPLLKACTNEDDVQELLYDMRALNIQADVVTYNTMIQTLCEKRELTEASKLVSEMESRGISPNARTYSLLMNGMLKAGKPSACLTLFEAASSNSRTSALTENVHVYTTAIAAASVLGDHERAFEIVSRMSARGVKPNLKTLTALMGASLASRRPELAVRVFNKIENPDGYAMRQGIQALCASGDVDAAAALIESQRRRGSLLSGKETMLSYKDVIKASLSLGDFMTARRMLGDLLAKGFIPNKSIFFSIIKALNLSDRGALEFTHLSVDKFRFLLFTIDSLQKRKLPAEGALYAATLALGSQLGGRPRRISNLLVQAHTELRLRGEQVLIQADEAGPCLVAGWEELLEKLDSFTDEVISKSCLPLVNIRVSPADAERVVRAGQAVLQGSKRRRSN